MTGARVRLVREGAIATVTINRPEARNALDVETLDALSAALSGLDGAHGLRCVVLTGAGDRAFVAGADVKAMEALDEAGAAAFAARGHRLCGLIEELAVPVIAAVNGHALGAGCELALACDFIYAAQTAMLGFPEVGLGVIPGFGGTQRLPRRVGVARARELVYRGTVLAADEALALGLVNAVVDRAALLERVRAVAADIAGKAPLAVVAAKRALRAAAGPLADGAERERALFASLFATRDQKIGMRAFIDKHPPAWTGK